MTAFWYFIAICLVFMTMAGIADHLPGGRAQWITIHRELSIRAAYLRYAILRDGRAQVLRRLHYRSLIIFVAILDRFLYEPPTQQQGESNDHR